MVSLEEALKSEGFEVICPLGSGAFATVYEVKWDKYPAMTFAAKCLSLKDQKTHNCQWTQFINEVMTLKNLCHPNIISIFYYFRIEEYFVLIFEYCPNGSLNDNIRNKGAISEDDFKEVARQCLDALLICHNHNISHRDIKPANILIDAYDRIKLTDFGLANITKNGELIDKYSGSLEYVPPEILKKQPYDPMKADIWSLGITFYVLLTGHLPWTGASRDEVVINICEQMIFIPNGHDHNITKLIKMMLNRNPKCRPSCEDLLRQPLFEKMHMTPMNQKNLPFLGLKKKSGRLDMTRTTSMCFNATVKCKGQANIPLAFQVKSLIRSGIFASNERLV